VSFGSDCLGSSGVSSQGLGIRRHVSGKPTFTSVLLRDARLINDLEISHKRYEHVLPPAEYHSVLETILGLPEDLKLCHLAW
jgi:hypothetical protein